MPSIAATRRTRGPGVPRRARRRNSLRSPATSTAGTSAEAVGAWLVTSAGRVTIPDHDARRPTAATQFPPAHPPVQGNRGSRLLGSSLRRRVHVVMGLPTHEDFDDDPTNRHPCPRARSRRDRRRRLRRREPVRVRADVVDSGGVAVGVAPSLGRALEPAAGRRLGLRRRARRFRRDRRRQGRHERGRHERGRHERRRARTEAARTAAASPPCRPRTAIAVSARSRPASRSRTAPCSAGSRSARPTSARRCRCRTASGPPRSGEKELPAGGYKISAAVVKDVGNITFTGNGCKRGSDLAISGEQVAFLCRR